MPAKVLFIIKKRVIEDKEGNKKIIQTGLYNSSDYLNNVLNEMGVQSSVEIVIDNNCIDKVVTKYRPTHVIIEALWVVPTKFVILCKLHPKVTWIIRTHSETPFIACEGPAMSWICSYSMFKNIKIATNTPRFCRELKTLLQIKDDVSEEFINDKVIYLPNYYPINLNQNKVLNKDLDIVNISCFGAVRPLKNQLIQAIAAIEFAKCINKKLRFHINATRHESNGSTVYQNINGLFSEFPSEKFELVEHPWYDREDFHTICEEIDIGLQVSFSETFNIVACDLLNKGVPIVCSGDIPWVDKKYTAVPTESIDIRDKLLLTWENAEDNVLVNRRSLERYINESKKIWYNYFK